MKKTLQLEELGLFILCSFMLYLLTVPWWIYVCLVLAPDIGMLGYLVNNRVGAYIYNFLHHKGLGALITGLGIYFFADQPHLIWVGLIWLGHASMDRFFGYGLKHFTGFDYTHLGLIGQAKKEQDIQGIK